MKCNWDLKCFLNTNLHVLENDFLKSVFNQLLKLEINWNSNWNFNLKFWHLEILKIQTPYIFLFFFNITFASFHISNICKKKKKFI